MTTDLREGLAKLLSDYSPCGCLDCQDSCHERADEILTYLHAHDGHAEFVRACRTIAEQLAITNEPESWEHDLSVRLAALCDAELAKENGNG